MAAVLATLAPMGGWTPHVVVGSPAWPGPAVVRAESCTRSSTALQVTQTPANGSGAAPLQVTWNISHPQGSTPPYTTAWSFGDGNSMGAGDTYDLNASEIYRYVGNFTASVTIDDSAPSCHEYTTSFSVHVSGPSYHGSFWLTPGNFTGPSPSVVNYTAHVTGITNYTVSWTAGAYPWTATGTTMRVIFVETGPVVVEASLFNAAGAVVANAAVVANITGPPLFSVSATPTNGTAPLNVTFHAMIGNNSLFPTNGTVMWWIWSGAQVCGTTANYTFQEPPPWEGGVTTENVYWGPGCGLGSTAWAHAVVLITVLPSHTGSNGQAHPLVEVRYPSFYGVAPLTEPITITGYGGYTPYTLSMCDVGTSNSSTPPCWAHVTNWSGAPITINHTWTRPGSYGFWADMTDVNGTLASSTIDVVQVNASAPLHVAPHSTSTRGPAALTVGFNASILGGDPPYSVGWNFGDGTVATTTDGDSVSHTYTSAGTFDATVTVTDSLGSRQSGTVPIQVAPAPVQATHPGPNLRSGPTSTPGSAGPSWSRATLWPALAVLVGGVVIAVLVVVRIRLWKREGEAWLAEGRSGEPGPPDPVP
ncbi:MAG TPA: PKD domain-containing protein [Thermoplasmata archaeon]|nr:PKD domain-containing protein [Thermoplasmata archaeon]